VYVKHLVLSIEFEVKTLRIELQVGLDLLEYQQHRLNQINELDEIIQDYLQQTSLVQQRELSGMKNSLRKRNSRR
jgi:hypothetical protein